MGNYTKYDTIKDIITLVFQVSVEFIPNTMAAITEYSDMQDITPFTSHMLKRFEKETIYRINTLQGVHYSITCFQDLDKEYLMIIGPCRFQEDMDEYLKNNGNIKTENYYNTIPVLEKDKLNILSGIASRFLYQKEIKFKFITLEEKDQNNKNAYLFGKSADEMNHLRYYEQLHQLEEQLIAEVSVGNKKEAHEIYQKLYMILKKKYILTDPLRNAKCYSYQMNTLVRKAAEKGGASIFLAYMTFYKYMKSADQAFGVKEIHKNNFDMLSEYCNLVQENTKHKYSKNIGIIINYINMNLGTEMSLASLSQIASITPTYLSNIFKKEVGTSVMEYITQRRVSLAKELLEQTDLQSKEIAGYIGFNDVSYFNRVFKKRTGVTPTEYRKCMKI